MFLLSVLVYSNSLHGEFQFDDDRLIRFNFTLRNLLDLQSIVDFERYRPLALITFAANFAIGRKDPFSYHLVNVFLHGVATVLFFLLLRRSSQNLIFCTIAGVLFAVHPLNTESVAYISGRFILLCTMFYLSAMLAFDSYLRKRNIFRLLVFLFFTILAILSKEEGALILLAAIVYNFAFFGTESVRRNIVLHLVPLVIVGTAVVYRILLEMQAENLPHPVTTYFATEMFVWLRYLWLAFFPMRLNVDHDVPELGLQMPVFWASIGVVIAILFGLWRMRKSHPSLFFWGVWFFLNLLASSSFIPLNDFMAEHRTYISTMGFCAAAGYLGILFRKRDVEYSRLIALSLSVLIILFSAATLIRNRVWETKLTLWYDATIKSPEKFRPHLNLAYSLFERGAYREALREYTIARDLQPMVPRIHTGLGFCYIFLGNPVEAEKSLNIALSLDLQYIDAKTGLGMLRFREQKYGEALAYFEQAFPHRKESVDLIAMMAVCYLNTGQADHATVILRQGALFDDTLQTALHQVERNKTDEALATLWSIVN